MYFFVALVTACIFGGARTQELFTGSCPNVATKSDFNITRYTGLWYEFENYFAAFEIGGNCVTAEYLLLSADTVSVNNTAYYPLFFRYISVVGDAKQLDPANPGMLGVRFGSSESRGDYRVLETDYEQFSIVLSCNEQTVPIINYTWNAQILWILTREREGISGPLKQYVYNTIRDFGLSTRQLKATTQSRCP